MSQDTSNSNGQVAQQVNLWTTIKVSLSLNVFKHKN